MVYIPEENYITSDYGEAAYLITKKKRIINIERVVEGKYQFLFPNKEICKKLCNDYIVGKGKIIARDYFDNLSKIKNMIADAKRRDGLWITYPSVKTR